MRLILLLLAIVGCSSNPTNNTARSYYSCDPISIKGTYAKNTYICKEYPEGRIYFRGEMQQFEYRGRKYRHGRGTEYFENGDMWSGYYEMGERSGYGTYISETSNCKNFFINGLKSSNHETECIYKDAEFEGHSRKGMTDKEGKWVGRTIYTYPSGKIIEQYISNGEAVSTKVIKTEAQAKKEKKKRQDSKDEYEKIYANCMLDNSGSKNQNHVVLACQKIASNPSIWDKLKYSW